jgi:hypothetical protein
MVKAGASPANHLKWPGPLSTRFDMEMETSLAGGGRLGSCVSVGVPVRRPADDPIHRCCLSGIGLFADDSGTGIIAIKAGSAICCYFAPQMRSGAPPNALAAPVREVGSWVNSETSTVGECLRGG